MVKAKFHLTRLHMNRIIVGWKNHTRAAKVQKVKSAIITHGLYKKKLYRVMRQWKFYIKMNKIAFGILNNLADRNA